jgi:transposase, IS5 family
MLCERYDPVNLFDMIAPLSLKQEPELERLDRLLEDDALFQLVKADLARRAPRTLTHGRHSTPVAVILRMLVVQRLYHWSYEQTEYFVGDSRRLRQFCRLGLHTPPDDTTLIRWAQQITPETMEQLNHRVVELARQAKVTRGRKLRVDTTLVETTMHHPTDGSLLADGVRVLSRLLRGAKAAGGEALGLGARVFASHTRAARQWVRVIHGLARRVREAEAERKQRPRRERAAGDRGRKRPSAVAAAGPEARAGAASALVGAPATPPPPTPPGAPAGAPPEKKRRQAQAAMQEAYASLIAVAKQSVAQAKRVRGALGEREEARVKQLCQELDAVVPRVQQVIRQAERRVIAGERVPAKEKLVSLFEPHTQIVKRGKAGRVVEFGRKVLLDEVEGGMISGYRILPEPGSDAPYLKASLENHQERFGRAPRLLAGDRGFYSPGNEALAKARGVKRVAIPYAGKAPPERVQEEKQRWFRTGYRFRAGIEGRISVAKRRFGLDCCRDHGEAGMGRWVGWGVVTSNLVQIARATAAG